MSKVIARLVQATLAIVVFALAVRWAFGIVRPILAGLAILFFGGAMVYQLIKRRGFR